MLYNCISFFPIREKSLVNRLIPYKTTAIICFFKKQSYVLYATYIC